MEVKGAPGDEGDPEGAPPPSRGLAQQQGWESLGSINSEELPGIFITTRLSLTNGQQM